MPTLGLDYNQSYVQCTRGREGKKPGRWNRSRQEGGGRVRLRDMVDAKVGAVMNISQARTHRLVKTTETIYGDYVARIVSFLTGWCADDVLSNTADGGVMQPSVPGVGVAKAHGRDFLSMPS